jgi:multisubunit Na+/H+ antiporter MnhE subunit
VVAAIVVVMAATFFGYGVVWLLGREPLTTADVAVGVLTGLGGVALARAVMGGSFEGALIVACVAALALQTLRRRSNLEVVE